MGRLPVGALSDRFLGGLSARARVCRRRRARHEGAIACPVRQRSAAGGGRSRAAQSTHSRPKRARASGVHRRDVAAGNPTARGADGARVGREPGRPDPQGRRAPARRSHRRRLAWRQCRQAVARRIDDPRPVATGDGAGAGHSAPRARTLAPSSAVTRHPGHARVLRSTAATVRPVGDRRRRTPAT